MRFTLIVYVSHKVNVLVTYIILNITSREHLIFTSLHIGSRLFELFSKEVHVKKTTRNAFKCYYSCIIARLSDVGLPALFVAALQYFKFFSVTFKHSYLCTLASRGTLPCAFGVNIQVKSCNVRRSLFVDNFYKINT